MTDPKETTADESDENDATTTAQTDRAETSSPAAAPTSEVTVTDTGSDVEATAAKTKRTRSPRAKVTKSTEAPGAYAVVETGGKQYRVSVGDSLSVERLVVDSGSDISLDRVLLVSDNGSTRVGTPVVDGATVSARVDNHFRGEKIVVFKYKPKKRYRRRTGHRQALTRLTITGISG